ncbi:hypothetical protein GE061_002053 [Apolygus lucorum]|uniref:Cholesterol side-chain cleavage enzyme, mitochondrial n=1 Tax=Apolygus lucorum TaxID=248454 RepID=A0A8S9X3K0_APOLU|nr:hypothetical protein GE061_002053 [Apolygus lucorum]
MFLRFMIETSCSPLRMLRLAHCTFRTGRKFSKGNFVRAPTIPYDGGLPFVGTSLAIGAAGGAPKLHEYVDSRHKQLGPIFRENMGPVTAVFVSDPSLIRKVFLVEGKFPKHFVPKAWSLYNELHKCKRGLFFMDGEEWYTLRRVMNKYFLSPESIKNLEGLHENLVSHLIQRWKRFDGQEVENLEFEFYRHSISFVLGSLIGNSYWNKFAEYNPYVDELAQKFQQVFETSSKLNVLPSVKLVQFLGLPVWKTFESAVGASLDATLSSVVTKMFPLSREVQTDPQPIVEREFSSTGVQANIPKPKIKGPSLEHQFTQVPNFSPSLCHFLSLLVLLGINVGISFKLYNELYVEKRFAPVATTQTCCLCRMARNVVKKAFDDLSENGLLYKLASENLHEDVISALVSDLLIAAGDTTAFTSQWAVYLLGRDRSVQDAVRRDPSLIRGVVRETLRLYPSAAFIARVLPNAETIDGYHLEKEELVLLSLYTAGRYEKLYPSADKFLPDRWTKEGTGKYKGVLNVNGYLPFAMGARSCIGARLANAQLNMTLSHLLENYDLDTKEESGMVLRLVPVPSRPVRLRIQSRKK